MTKISDDAVPVVLYECDATDYAWDTGLPDDILGRIPAKLPRSCYDDIVTARAALVRHRGWDSITVASQLESDALRALLDASDDWRTGHETFKLYQFPGLFLRLTHKHDAQTQVEFEVCLADGTSL